MAVRKHTLGGEIESRLAYTQKSEGQNLPERSAFAQGYGGQAHLRFKRACPPKRKARR
jgi:hypothetical protein